MHPVLLLALGAAGGWAAYRWLSKSGDKKGASKNKEDLQQGGSATPLRDAEDLEPDPTTGVYTSKEEQEK